jgi:hypothetical protein
VLCLAAQPQKRPELTLLVASHKIKPLESKYSLVSALHQQENPKEAHPATELSNAFGVVRKVLKMLC